VNRLRLTNQSRPEPMQLEEPALVDRARCDSEAFGELYERYCDRIYTFTYARLNTRTEAEDAASEVFLKALRGIPGYRRTNQSFSAWLYRIAANVVADRYRRRPIASLEDAPDSAIESADIAETIVQRARVRSVWAAVDTLPRQQRMAITLRFSADLSNETIAGVMGKSTPAIKQLLHRGVHALRAKLAVGDIEGPATRGDPQRLIHMTSPRELGGAWQ
jgi:RNA polymerase sigma-70 factor (ECF subfamily)